MKENVQKQAVLGVKTASGRAADVARINRILGLQALVLCRDSQASQPLFQVLSELGITAKLYHETTEALDAIQRRKFDLLVVECDDTRGGVEFLQAVRHTPAHGAATILAILARQTSVVEAFKMGATLALEKPFSANLLNLILRAALGNMLRERRRAFRHPVEIPLVIHLENGPEVRATAINLSESGMAVQAPFPLSPNQMLNVRFVLPKTKLAIDAEATVTWSERHGRAGIRFLRVQHLARHHFEAWLREQFERLTENLQKQEASLTGPGLRPGSSPSSARG